MKSWCSGSQQISASSLVQFTVFTIRQNLTKMFCFPSAVPRGGGWCRHCRRPCAFGSPTQDYSAALPFQCPISSQITSELWTTYFSLSQWLFFSYPPGSSWAVRDSASLEPGSWLVTCFPVAGEEFPEDKWYACRSQGNWGAAKSNRQTGPGKAPHTLSPEERNVCGNWEQWNWLNSAPLLLTFFLVSSPALSSPCHKHCDSETRGARLLLQPGAPQGGIKRFTG